MGKTETTCIRVDPQVKAKAESYGPAAEMFAALDE